ncbi:MAG: DUF2975 domain-containing protein [Acidobacteria bacterium]|nr:DUF2975 domain-containing protein [Acidobacteriota bacterium]
MGRLTVAALRGVLAFVFVGTVVVQVAMLWVLVNGNDPEEGSAALTAMRVITLVGMLVAQVIIVCVWCLLTMVRRGTLFSSRAFRYVDLIVGAIVAAALLWFAVAAVNAPGQRDDPGVTVIMAGIGVALLGVALIVRILRILLAQAVEGPPADADGPPRRR